MSPFLYIGVTFAIFQSDGHMPDVRLSWKMCVRKGAISTAQVLRILLGMLSSPDALLTFIPCKSFKTPFSSIEMFSILGYESWRGGRGLDVSSLVKTDENCFSKISALDLLLSNNTPFYLRGLIPTLSILLDFT